MKYCTHCGAELNDDAVVCIKCGCGVAGKVKYCTHCGAEVNEDAVVCIKCGCSLGATKAAAGGDNETLKTIIKVFMIIGCVTVGWAIIPLAWCIPMTLSVFRSLKEGRPISMAMKICCLIFVNVVAGVCMLCMKDD